MAFFPVAALLVARDGKGAIVGQFTSLSFSQSTCIADLFTVRPKKVTLTVTPGIDSVNWYRTFLGAARARQRHCELRRSEEADTVVIRPQRYGEAILFGTCETARRFLRDPASLDVAFEEVSYASGICRRE